ncbi:hypothetical protein HGRIS_007663 [Hohenbuehelia grisea]|uniref:Uncharacterized protein n=1 Tax=Hohenbuehelia grisea TaxID=104357 RepID=A0ABR3J5J3_9AGAR
MHLRSLNNREHHVLQRRAAVFAAASAEEQHQTTTIIAVCVTIGGIVLILVTFRVVQRILARRAEAVPLPPVQPLAHHREMRLAQLEAGYDSNLPTPTTLGRNGSNVSLLVHEKPKAHKYPSRHASFAHSDATLDSPRAMPPATEPLDPSLVPPTPKFHSARSSFVSSGSDTDASSPMFTPPETPGMSHVSPIIPPPPTAWAKPLPSAPIRRASTLQKIRPPSVTGSASNSTRSAIRGPPHSRHSLVQIVLPAPLAPELYPYMRDDQSIYSSSRVSLNGDLESARMSVVDQWASLPTRSSSPATPPPRQIRRSLSSGPRLSISSQSTSQHSSAYHTPPRRISSTISRPLVSRSANASPSSVPPSAFPFLPPVPRIPSMYTPNTPTDLILDKASRRLSAMTEERGRSRSTSVSASLRSSSETRGMNRRNSVVHGRPPRSRSQSQARGG